MWCLVIPKTHWPLFYGKPISLCVYLPGCSGEGSFVLSMWRLALLLGRFQYGYVIYHSLKIFDVEGTFFHVENLSQDSHGQLCRALWSRE